jgi:hypothetical protein
MSRNSIVFNSYSDMTARSYHVVKALKVRTSPFRSVVNSSILSCSPIIRSLSMRFSSFLSLLSAIHEPRPITLSTTISIRKDQTASLTRIASLCSVLPTSSIRFSATSNASAISACHPGALPSSSPVTSRTDFSFVAGSRSCGLGGIC